MNKNTEERLKNLRAQAEEKQKHPPVHLSPAIPPSSAKFTISIVCHNNLAYTKKCIESIQKYSQDYELFITDNNSTDGTREYLQTEVYRLSNVFTFLKDSNEGFSKPHNDIYEISKRKSSSTYFIVLNNDVEVCPDWLKAMEKEFSNPNVALVGIKNSCCGLDKEGQGIPSTNIEYAEASCLMVRKKTVDVLFSDEFKFAYYEDSDLSLRMRCRGFEIKLVDIPVIHHRAVTANIVKEDLEGYKIRNKHLFINKWKQYLEKRNFDHSILVKRKEGMGDVILTIPVIKALKKKYPSSRITVQTRFPEIFAGNPNVYKAVPENHAGNFNLTYDLNLAYENNPHKHIIQAYAEVCNVIPEWDMEIYPQEIYDLNGLTGYIVLHTGKTSWKGRYIGIEKFNEVAAKLRKSGHKLVLVGNHATVATKEYDHNLIDKLSFHQLASVISRAKLFIGIDSMPMHVAQALKIPLVAVFGCILPEYRLLPDPRFKGITASNVGCLGCHHFQSAPRTYSDCLRTKPYCMENISSDMILHEATKLLS